MFSNALSKKPAAISSQRPGRSTRRHFVRQVALATFAIGTSAILSTGCVSSRKRLHLPELTQKDFIQVNDNAVFHLDQGHGSPIVVLHGFPDHSLNQRRLVTGLASEHRVLAYDRAPGLSQRSTRHYSLPQQNNELDAVLSATHIERPVLLGHSAGGTIAVRFAAANPQKVSALVLMNPVLMFEPGHTGLARFGSRILKQPVFGEVIMSMQTRFATKQILKPMFYDPSKLTEEIIDSYHFPFEADGTKRYFLQTLRSFFDLGSEEFLRDVAAVKAAQIPVLLLWADKDPNMPLADAAYLAERLGAELKTIPNSGHLPQLELDDAHLNRDVIEPIQTFLKALPQK